MQIQAIQTGVVRIKAAWKEGQGHGARRNLNAMLDPHWTEPLPIYAWVIEHPEGLIVVDTGETTRASRPGYFPWWHPLFRLAVREEVPPEDEIGPQLRRLGYAPDDVRWLIMTHLHTDHAGGLHHFPKATILVSHAEYQTARGTMGRLRGYLPQHWPDWFAPQFITFEQQPLGPFATSFTLTRAGDVQLVPTPGHSVGHLSVLVHEAMKTVVLAGDLSYTEDLFMHQRIDGVSIDEAQARDSLQRMLAYARQTPMVYLPSHDPDSMQRLRQRQVLMIDDATGHTLNA